MKTYPQFPADTVLPAHLTLADMLYQGAITWAEYQAECAKLYNEQKLATK